MRNLSMELNVSIRTIKTSLKQLEKEGFLEIFPRQRPRILNREATEGNAPPAYTSPWQKFYLDLKNEIAQGRRPIGYSLPKRQHYAQELGLSPYLIGKVYQQLEQEGYIYRKGSVYHVGARQIQVKGNTGRSRLTIAVVLPTKKSWRMFHESRWSGKFLSTFLQATESIGYFAKPVILTDQDIKSKSIPSSVKRQLDSGCRYAGTLLMDGERFPLAPCTNCQFFGYNEKACSLV